MHRGSNVQMWVRDGANLWVRGFGFDVLEGFVWVREFGFDDARVWMRCGSMMVRECGCVVVRVRLAVAPGVGGGQVVGWVCGPM